MSAAMRREPRASTTRPPNRDVLAEVARTQLLSLGNFAHLHVRRQAEHIVIEQPGPPKSPDDTHPVLRLTPIGGFRFGLGDVFDEPDQLVAPVALLAREAD